MKICPECHHRPSMRDGDPAYCYCKCHDVADAGPDLLAACERLQIVANHACNINEGPCAVGPAIWDDLQAACDEALAVIRKAK